MQAIVAQKLLLVQRACSTAAAVPGWPCISPLFFACHLVYRKRVASYPRQTEITRAVLVP